jgi:hypothetical protein
LITFLGVAFQRAPVLSGTLTRRLRSVYVPSSFPGWYFVLFNSGNYSRKISKNQHIHLKRRTGRPRVQWLKMISQTSFEVSLRAVAPPRTQTRPASFHCEFHDDWVVVVSS